MQESVETGIGGVSLDINEISSRSFNIFSDYNVDTSFKTGYYMNYYPIGNVDSGGPFEFIVPKDPKNWTDMQKTRLEGRLKVVKADGSDLTSSDNISVCNLFYQSLFENILFELENVKLDDPSPRTYPYKAYLETLLSYSTGVKNNWLNSLNVWESDTKDNFDTLGTGNFGFVKRKSLISGSKYNYFAINLYLDICHSYKYLPPNLSMKFSFRRNNDNFSLLTSGSDDYKIILENLKLKMYKVTPTEKIENFFKQNISKQPAKLNIDRSIIKTFTIPSGTSNLSQYKIFEGNKLPEQIIVGILPQVAFNGVKNKNPFNFLPHNLREANLLVNGLLEPPNRYTLNTEDKDLAGFYLDFLENIGISNDNKEIGLNLENYYGGNFLIAFDRSPDKSNRYRPFMTEGGIMDINLHLRTPTTEVLTLIIYATYTDIISIDQYSMVNTSYSI